MTTQQVTAIIFAEHEKLSKENPLLKEQINSLETLNNLWETSDSIQNIEIKELEKDNISKEKEIKQLKKSKKRILVGSSVGGVLLFILGLLL